ncbi:S-adenosyl-L-methionine-dependent methyltransferase [Cylindrobasidium torrendii FP15055 ss-10]|uniref:S-adenosyl-L-methionine-dependent methyltransferase n=1 Tax=Cylindrobasidium torrendii FP15055 ss-10 TaxID=1314674 RepID=A0A0D7BU74_9AGAR|nr:S-adenosyl-L-methionine-dependent methyltransferase [Cylindrobasidium torrendii FP15055 ss-10]
MLPLRFARRPGRGLASLAPNSVNPYNVFDKSVKRLQKDRAALKNNGETSRTVDYLRDEIADRLLERFEDIKRKFPKVVDVGSGAGHFTRLLQPETVGSVLMLESSEKLLHRDSENAFNVPVQRIHADEEDLLQVVEPNSMDAAVSCLSLQWINDLPGMFVQINRALKPDAPFLGAMFGGETLFELRTALQLAQVDREGGIAPHISPLTDTRDVSNLLGRAGFHLLTVDLDEIQVSYPSMWELMDDLRDMGEGNAVSGRRSFVHRDTLTAASAIYKEMHGNEDGTVPATFQVVFFIGWKQDPNAPKHVDKKSTIPNAL